MTVEEETDSALSDRNGSKCDVVLSYLNSLNEEETFSLCILGRLGIHGTDMKTGDIFLESGLSFCHMGSKDQIQVASLCASTLTH